MKSSKPVVAALICRIAFPNQVEKDYFDWDGLVTRQRKLEEMLPWLA